MNASSGIQAPRSYVEYSYRDTAVCRSVPLLNRSDQVVHDTVIGKELYLDNYSMYERGSCNVSLRSS